MKNLSFKYKLFLGMSFIVILYASVSVLFVELYVKKILHLLQSCDFSEIETNFRNIMKPNTEIAYIFIQKDNQVLVHTFNNAVAELVKSRQDMAVIDTARAFLHHIRQPLTYLAMAIDILSDEISEDNKLNIASVRKKLRVVEDAGKTLSELLRKFDNLKEYKVMLFDNTTKITDIEGWVYIP